MLDPYLVFFVALVARDQRDLDDLSRKVDFFDMMLRLLQTRRENDSLILMDDAHALQAGFVKAEQLAVSHCSLFTRTSMTMHRTDLESS